jgi:hypothetical protein
VRTAHDDRHVIVYRVGSSHIGSERSPIGADIDNARR